MAQRTTTGALVTAVAALGLVLTGCGGSDSTASESSSETSATESSAPSSTPASSTSSAAPTSAQSAPIQTVDDYLKENGIERTFVHKGDPGIPVLNLPTPAGWVDLGQGSSETAYTSYILDPDAGKNAPAILVTMVRLSGGKPDPAKILQLAPNALQKLPGYDGPDAGNPDQLGGFEATVAGGTFTQDGAPWLVARKTVVIPGKDGMYLLAIDAQGPEDRASDLLDATAQIDDQTTIVP